MKNNPKAMNKDIMGGMWWSVDVKCECDVRRIKKKKGGEGGRGDEK